MVTGRPHIDHPAIWTGHCRQARAHSEKPLIVHVDGEFFCLPEEIRDIDVELLPGALRVIGRMETAKRAPTPRSPRTAPGGVGPQPRLPPA
jgi:diacylglycerol kinase family enzyme